MVRISDLLKKISKEKINFYKLKDLAEIGTGSSDRKDALEDGEYPFYVRSKEILKINKYEYDETAIIIPGEGGIGDIFHYVEGKYALHQRAYRIHVIDNRLNTKYLYYYMFSKFKDFINQKAVTATVTSIRKPMIEQFEVAIPPMDIQLQIVKVLDNLTTYLSFLESELALRKKQYEFYETKLLDFKNRGIDYKVYNFEELASFSQGIQVDVNKQFFEKFNNCVQFLRIVDFVNDNEQPRYIEKPDDKYINNENEMIMIRYGASACGKVFLNKSGAIANNMFKINLKDDKIIDIEYLKFYLSQRCIYEKLNSSSGKSTMPSINFRFLNKLEIPVPSIEEQIKIVNKLNHFDNICNSMDLGLPAEIKARQKQYEYYRDLLFGFKEVEVNE